MQIAFLGFGQIGGSIARAATSAGFASGVAAWTPSGVGPEVARADGFRPAGTAAEAIAGADLIVLAAPPLACLGLLDELAGPLAEHLAPDAVITDVASTKGAIVGRARALRLRFVGGHPMAGRETAGYGAADPDLFRARPWVVVPADPGDAAADARVVALAEACGARPVRLTARDHDDAVAAISHVPLIVSAALVEAFAGRSDFPAAARLAAGGWASMTRLARGDTAMGAGIVATNAGAIAERLRALDGVIAEWLAVLAGDEDGAVDASAVERRLAAAQQLLAAADRGADAGAEAVAVARADARAEADLASDPRGPRG